MRNENIGLRVVYDNLKWIQDNKFFVEKEGKPHVLVTGEVSDNCKAHLRIQYDTESSKVWPYMVGGDTFIGKKPNGEKWLLMSDSTSDIYSGQKHIIARNYGIKEENIYSIPSPNFHLDMLIRPVGYPYVLVNDPELSRKRLNEIRDDSSQFHFIDRNFERYEVLRNMDYASCNTVCKALENKGFIPIRVAGVFDHSVNFMNAVVNQHEDGKISYITNSTKCKSNEYYSKLEKMFEDDLRERVNLDKIYFISGWINENSSYIMDTLNHGHGGIHCMSLEEPNFETWG